MADPGIIIRVLALAFGVTWIWINVYQFYPVLSYFGVKFLQVLQPGESQSEQEPVGVEESRRSEEAFETDGGRVDERFETDGGQPEEPSLPGIDLFVPAYEEGAVIEQAISSIRSCDYRHDLLNLVVLLEPDDESTPAALDDLAERFEFETLTVPEEYPGDPNKPRALNYGYEQTSSEIVGILDAEELMAPDLCRKVALRLTNGYDFAQSRLDMVNEDDGWLNTMFRAEYGYWYETSITGFANREYPIPMAGTTCFFRRSVLDEISDRRIEKFGDPWDAEQWEWIADAGLSGTIPWDPNNVTEDFELGLFLWQEGYQFAYIDTVTQSESPLTLDSWVKQRTRWQKGKVYTFKQYLSNPPKGLLSKLHLYTQSSIPHLGAINFTGIFVVLLGANLFRGYVPKSSTLAVLSVSLAFGLVMMGLYSYGYVTASNQPLPKRLRRAVVVFFSLPLYWFIQWIADIRALRQVYTGQLHWSKTTHLGRNTDESAAVATSVSEDDGLALPRLARLGALEVIVLIGVGLRIYELADRSLYGDELYSVYRATRPLPELLTVSLSTDSHPPLYYALLHFWIEAFGSSTFAVRTLTVFLATGTIVGLYWLGTELYDDRVGLVAALLFSVSSFYVHFGRVARMYSLLTLLTVLSWYGFVRLRRGRLRDNVGYALASVLLIYTHVYGLFVVMAQNVYVALSETRNDLSWRRWLSLQAVLGVATAPWLFMLLSRVLNLSGASSGSNEELVTWIPAPEGLRSIIKTLSRFVGFPIHYPFLQGTPDAPLSGIANPWALSWQLSALLVAVYVCCGVIAVFRYRSDGEFEIANVREASQLAVLFLCPILVPFALSYLLEPVYWTRYTIPASVGFVLLAARGITSINSAWRRRTLLGFILVSAGFMTSMYYTQSSVEDWEGAAGCLNEVTDDDDMVVYQPAWVRGRLYEYYEHGEFAERTLPRSDSVTDERLHEVHEYAQDDEDVFLLRYHPGQEPGETLGPVIGTFNDTHEPQAAVHDGVFSVYHLSQNETSEPANGTTLASACPSAPPGN